MNLLRKLKEISLSALFPVSCASCGIEGEHLCAQCRDQIPLIPFSCAGCGAVSPLGITCKKCFPVLNASGAIAAVSYSSQTIQALIRTWKYSPAPSLTTPFARLLVRQIRRNSAVSQILSRKDTLVIPIPLSSRKKRMRGFNPPEDLAKRTLAMLGSPAPLAAGCLAKTRNTPSLAKIQSPQIRFQMVQRVYGIPRPFLSSIYNKHIILVDDVITSGATCSACASLLRAAGARSVWLVALAYGWRSYSFKLRANTSLADSSSF